MTRLALRLVFARKQPGGLFCWFNRVDEILSRPRVSGGSGNFGCRRATRSFLAANACLPDADRPDNWRYRERYFVVIFGERGMVIRRGLDATPVFFTAGHTRFWLSFMALFGNPTIIHADSPSPASASTLAE